METLKTNYVTKHAENRSQHRGVTLELLALHEKYADKKCFVGGGCLSRTLTNTAVSEMRLGGIQQQKIEKIRKMAVLYTPNNKIVTLLFVRQGYGRTYRRGSQKRYQAH